MSQPRMVYIEWEDSNFDDGWQTRERALKHKQSLCRTVGFLLKKGKQCVTVNQNISHRGNVSDLIAIPNACIKRMATLKEVKK